MEAIKPMISEAGKHQSLIDALVRDTHAEANYVKELFDRELAQLEARSKVRNYLVLFACRNVKAALQETHRNAASS